jgi:hypothetical protein
MARLYAYALGALALVTIIGLGYLHYTSLLEERDTLRQNVARVETALETQRAATAAAVKVIGEWSAAQERTVETLRELAQKSEAAREEGRRINRVLAEHDLGALAAARPGLVQRRLDDGTARALRMLRDATDLSDLRAAAGAAPTDHPAAATDAGRREPGALARPD